MPDVLSQVTYFIIIVKGRSCELLRKLALQDSKRGELETLTTAFFWSALELQFSLLDPSLDQLVEDSDVGRFFDSSPSLTVISFCLDTMRINLVIGVVFVEGASVWAASDL